MKRNHSKNLEVKIVRYKILVISSLFLLALFSIKSYAPDWDTNPGGQSADDLISGGYGSYSDLSSQAQASRAEWTSKTGDNILGTSSSNKLSSGATNPKDARSEEQNQTPITQPVETNSTSVVQPKTSSGPVTAAGSWSLELNDSTSKIAGLTLFQNGDTIYGTGNVNLDANTTLMAAASGTISGDNLNLDLVSIEKVKLYRISMTLNGDSAAGSYAAFSPGATLVTGTATGTRYAVT